MADAPAEVEIRRLVEDEVPGLVSCLRRCYGDSYASPAFYDAAWVRGLLREERLHSRIGVTPQGRVVAHLGALLDAPGAATADAMMGTVDPDYRGAHLLGRVGAEMARVFRDLGLLGVQLYALSLHTITQRQIKEGGGVETGVLLTHFPSRTRLEGFAMDATDHRPAAVFMFLGLQPLPERRIHLPSRYREVARVIHARLGCERSFAEAGRGAADVSRLERDEPVRGLRRLFARALGSDFARALEAALDSAAAGAEAWYLDLPLDDPAAPAAADAAREHGFFFGGFVMERGGTDRLRLQRVRPETVSIPAMDLFHGDARALLGFVREDAREVGVELS